MGIYHTVEERGTEKVAVYKRKHVVKFLKGKSSSLDVSAYV
jgi:hypothetical protein